MHGAGNYSAASSRTDQSERSGCGGRAGAERVVRRALAGLAAGTARDAEAEPEAGLAAGWHHLRVRSGGPQRVGRAAGGLERAHSRLQPAWGHEELGQSRVATRPGL